MSKTELNIAINRIKEKVQLSKIVSLDVSLKKKGKEFVGQCPFHIEKTGSFFVNDEKGTFHCFGCGASGDLIEYLIKKDKITFMQAVEKLSGIAGIKPPDKTNYKNTFENQQKVLQKTVEFFKSELLQSKKALEYCEQRGIDSQIIDLFSIGYAGNNCSQLLEYLNKFSFSETDIISSGLFIKKENKFIGRFRDRVIFPIFNKNGWPIAFGGRGLAKDSIPKYLNSPESELFKKKEVLYGYNFASRNSSETKQIIIVEGYMDTITMHKFGFDTSVATMGTNFSTEHLAKVWKYSNEPIVCFDGDQAGYKAMTKLATMTMQHLKPGKSMRFCLLPYNADPDSFLKDKGAKTLQELLSNSLNLIDFFWDNCIKQLYEIDNRTPEKTAKWKKEIDEILNSIQDSDIKKLYKSNLKEKIFNILNPKTHQNKNFTSIQRALHFSVNFAEKILLREAVLLYTIVMRYSIAQLVIENLSTIVFTNSRLRKIRDSILESPGSMTLSEDDVELIKAICKGKCNISEMDDDEVLEFWHDVYNIGFSKPQQKEDINSAKTDCINELNRATWERLKALKIDYIVN